MRFLHVTRFRLLLLVDVFTVAIPFLIASPPQRVTWPLAFVLAAVSGLAHRRADRLPEQLSRRQMRVRAGIALVVYPLWIIGIVCVAIAFGDPRVWAVASVFIPVLCVFGWMSVRAKLGLEPNIGGYT